MKVDSYGKTHNKFTTNTVSDFEEGEVKNYKVDPKSLKIKYSKPEIKAEDDYVKTRLQALKFLGYTDVYTEDKEEHPRTFVENKIGDKRTIDFMALAPGERIPIWKLLEKYWGYKGKEVLD